MIDRHRTRIYPRTVEIEIQLLVTNLFNYTKKVEFLRYLLFCFYITFM